MRGTRRWSPKWMMLHGIIPAYAGNTRHSQPWQSNLWDHPRVCGEHYGVSPFTPCALGSSPRMRGTLDVSMVAPLFSWIIPAYAGNTSLPHKRICRHRDHPRVCGEHDSKGRRVAYVAGSSPRMRGTQGRVGQADEEAGIIPAYAGNTLARSRRPSRARDHPRVCGEHLVVGGEAVTSAGSSPRMRGTRVDRVHGDFVGGIIPAYAGNTSRTTRTAHGSRDHPRVCGEH